MDAEKKKISLKEKQDEGRPASKEAEKKPASKAADSRKVDPKGEEKETQHLPKDRALFKDSWGELKKVTWPTRKEWIAYSIAVLVFILVLTIVVGAFDYLMSLILQLIIK